MSLIRPSDSSVSYADSDPYLHKMNGQSTSFSTERFMQDTQLFQYGTEMYSPDVYGQLSFIGVSPESPLDLSSPEFNSCLDEMQMSPFPYELIASTTILDDPFSTCFSAAREDSISDVFLQSSQSISQSPTDNVSSEHEVEFDKDDVKLKLQELEHALLDDVEEVLGSYNVSAEEKWAVPHENILASESIIMCVDGNKEMPTIKQLLFSCASAISDGRVEDAQSINAMLRQTVSIQGNPSQRLAAYLVEGLAAKIVLSGQGIYKALRCKEPPTLYQLSAMQVLFEICPCFRFGFMAANFAMAEAFKGEHRVHIVDFDINQGSQYISLLQALSAQPNKPPHLRITGVDDPETVQRSVGGLSIIGQRLEKLAEDCGIPFEFQAVGANIGDITPMMLDCRPDEVLVVNFAFQLHHLPDESISTINLRDRLLRTVKSMRPKLVTLVEHDVNTNTAPFLPRFNEVYNFYSAIFDSIDATLPRESTERMNVERQCLAREIVNIIACDGVDRIERYEAAGKWKSRMKMAGFVPCPFNSSVTTAVKSLLKTYCNRYKFEEECGGLYFGWEDKNLIYSSAWR